MMYCTDGGGVEKIWRVHLRSGRREPRRCGRWTPRDVDPEAPAIAQAARHGIDDEGDLRKSSFDGGCDLGIFVIDDARDLKGGLGVESLRGFVGAFGGEVVKSRG